MQIASVNVFEFHAAFTLKFLNEMTVPMQSRFECVEWPFPAPLLPALLEGKHDLPNREIPPRNVRRQSRAMAATLLGLGDKPLITPSALVQKVLERPLRRGDSTGLEVLVRLLPSRNPLATT
jgi:hypothetical protein